MGHRECDICGKKFEGQNAGKQLGGHRASHSHRVTRNKNSRQPARTLKAQLKLVTMIQELFPKNIQTKDSDQLLADLQFIESLRERL